MSAQSALASSLFGDQHFGMKIYSYIFFPLFNSFHLFLSGLTYFYHLTQFFNARNYFVSPAMFSKLSKHSAYAGVLPFCTVP